jgi:hypothetical protein
MLAALGRMRVLVDLVVSVVLGLVAAGLLAFRLA